MKKLLAVLTLALFLTPAYAGIDEGIEKGMTHVSLLGGVAVPTSHYEGNDDIYMGDGGGAYGLQIMHYLTPVFGLGVEFTGVNAGEDEYSIYGIGLNQSYKYSYDRYAAMLAAKVNFAPAAKTRLYLPFGVGMNYYKGKVKAEGTSENGEVSANSTKPAFYLGLGLETDLNDIFIFGFEARYTGFCLDKNKFGDTSYGDDVSLLLKLGVKF